MRDELKAKLREIFLSKKYMQLSVDPTIYERIDQAYKDAGYGPGLGSHIYSNKGAEQLCMTGQEWYERFMKELLGISFFMYGKGYYPIEVVHKAAKRASGLLPNNASDEGKK